MLRWVVGKEHNQKCLVLGHLQGCAGKVGEMAAEKPVSGFEPGREVSQHTLCLPPLMLLLGNGLEQGGGVQAGGVCETPHTHLCVSSNGALKAQVGPRRPMRWKYHGAIDDDDDDVNGGGGVHHISHAACAWAWTWTWSQSCWWMTHYGSSDCLS